MVTASNKINASRRMPLLDHLPSRKVGSAHEMEHESVVISYQKLLSMEIAINRLCECIADHEIRLGELNQQREKEMSMVCEKLAIHDTALETLRYCSLRSDSSLKRRIAAQMERVKVIQKPEKVNYSELLDSYDDKILSKNVSGKEYVAELVIPKYVEQIGEKYFYGWKSLERIRCVDGSILSVIGNGTESFLRMVSQTLSCSCSRGVNFRRRLWSLLRSLTCFFL